MANPIPYFERYREIIPDFDAFTEAVRDTVPLHARVNTLKTDAGSVRRYLEARGLAVEPEHWCELMLKLDAKTAGKLGTSLGHTLGHFYLQSASSAVAALALDVAPGDRVLDLCAAPGSKTTFLAQRMEGRGVIVANEPSRKRITSLLVNCRRMGIPHAVLTSYTGQNFPLRRSFNRVLVDAPCSGEGTWLGAAARPKGVSKADQQRLTDRQTSILERALEVLEPGGELVYSTCTYAPEENEMVVAPMIEKFGLDVLEIPVALPACPGLAEWDGNRFPAALSRAARLYPHRFASEGFFVVRLSKPV